MLTIYDGEISGNKAEDGGGIGNHGSITIYDGVISGGTISANTPDDIYDLEQLSNGF